MIIDSSKSLFCAVLILITAGCAQLPSRESIQPSYAIAADTPSTIGDAVGNNHPGLSGFYPLADGVDAFVARLALIDSAEHTIDVQYYLYHRQQTTILFTAFLLKAADRGVRIRLLLDDLSQADSELDLAALAVHPNIEVRLFNPFPNRRFRALGFVTNFSQLSRRMHNKSFIVDNRIFITGGRNIGNAYFSAEDHSEFIDLDVMSVGEIVPEASKAFDLYWNHQLSYPVEDLHGERDEQSLIDITKTLSTYVEQNQQSNYVEQLRESAFVKRLLHDEIEFDWQKSVLFYDHPDKVMNDVSEKSANMSPMLFKEMGEPKQKAIIVSPYFIPREQGVKLLTNWAKQGVDVTVLTNSLAATDVSAVHAGYKKYREDLVKGGVKLWELKPSDLMAIKRKAGRKVTGSSQASLHAKTMTFDDEKIFVGTMNLDPRSLDLNTEMGVLIESEKLSRFLAHWVDTQMPEYAWKVELKDNDLVWLDTVSNEQFDEEPQTSSWRRFQVWFISLFPIEDEL
ncbi:phospholipase D family protein [Pseudoalteromonas gelatinilytica]|uniref:phospholipase D family protein n=1 Tax=Pseudoalteromonas gelatinilytica TaxID=1703256 RepID=UPI00166A8B04|nr:phospholipase D family protein [Pseudoalteromonas profundi]